MHLIECLSGCLSVRMKWKVEHNNEHENFLLKIDCEKLINNSG